MTAYKSISVGDHVKWKDRPDSAAGRWGYVAALDSPDSKHAVVRLGETNNTVTVRLDELRDRGGNLLFPAPPATPDHILDPTDPFDNALIGIVKTNRAKRKDYTSGDAGIFENFERAADETKLTVEQVIGVMIAIKNARLRALLGREDEAVNESIEDTILDRTVYCAILRAWRITKQLAEKGTDK